MAPITTITGYVSLSLTALNSLINTALFSWNVVREKILSDEVYRSVLRRETRSTAATAVSEGASAISGGTKIGLDAYFNSPGAPAPFSGIDNHGLPGRGLIPDAGGSGEIINSLATPERMSSATRSGIGIAISSTGGIADAIINNTSAKTTLEKEQRQSPDLTAAPRASRGPKRKRAYAKLSEWDARAAAWGKAHAPDFSKPLSQLAAPALQLTAKVKGKLDTVIGAGQRAKQLFNRVRAFFQGPEAAKEGQTAQDASETAAQSENFFGLAELLFVQFETGIEAARQDLTRQAENSTATNAT